MRSPGWLKSLLLVGLLSPNVALSAAAPGSPGQPASDQEFVKRALAINEQEVELGHLASEQGGAPDVKAMGQKMVENHTRHGQKLGDLAGQLGVDSTPKLSADQRDAVARLRASSGSEFDAAFKKTVDDGHVNELAMYRAWLDHTDNRQARTLAQGRVEALQKSPGMSVPAK